MKHKIIINYECPLCGFKTMAEINDQYSYQNFPCFKCSDDDYIVYMDAVEMTQVITSKMDMSEPIYYIPSRLIFPSHSDLFDINEHCDICNKCVDCEKYVYDSDFKVQNCDLEYDQYCIKTSECCQSVNHTKLKYLAKNHMSYEEVWNLDNTIACFILPRLKFFKDNISSYPSSLTFERWKKILRYMIACFKIRKSDNDSFWFERKYNEFAQMKYNVYRKGKYYFYKYFDNLWD